MGSVVPAAPKDESRLFQQFFTDPTVTNQWWEVQFRLQNGAVPPVTDADGFLIGPVVAVAPFKNVEIGGRVFFVDYELDNPINVPGPGGDFDGESGANE